MTRRLYALILPLVASGADAQSPASSPVAPVSLAANPPRICVDDRGNRNPNFDIVVRNGTPRSLTINEVKAKSFDSGGNLIEQRILWQDALSLLGDQRKIPPGATGLVFNPFTFTAPNRAARIEYQLSFDELPSPMTLSLHPQSCLQKARLILPIKGRVLVYDGYDFLSHHRRQSYQEKSDLKAFGVVDNTFRFAIDLVPIDTHGQLFRGSGSSIEDWYGWSVPVRAPAAGVIAAVRDDMPDNPLGSEDYPKRKLSEDEMNADGNYILIDHGNGEVSSFSHLKRGSAKVRKGQHVKSGELVAVTGNSGATPIPHLHYELRTGWGVRGVRSWPPYFSDLRVLGGQSGPQAIAINTGDVVIAN
jgi:Peptidase family M23